MFDQVLLLLPKADVFLKYYLQGHKIWKIVFYSLLKYSIWMSYLYKKWVISSTLNYYLTIIASLDFIILLLKWSWGTPSPINTVMMSSLSVSKGLTVM